MTVFKHVTRINVSLWGERVGTIVEAPQRGGIRALPSGGRGPVRRRDGEAGDQGSEGGVVRPVWPIRRKS